MTTPESRLDRIESILEHYIEASSLQNASLGSKIDSYIEASSTQIANLTNRVDSYTESYSNLRPIPVNEILKLRQTFTRRGLQTFSEMPDSRYYPTLQRFLFFNRRSGLGFTVSGNS